jgi:hypothetical protein
MLNLPSSTENVHHDKVMISAYFIRVEIVAEAVTP